MSEFIFEQLIPNINEVDNPVPQLPYEEFYMRYGIHLPSNTIDIWGDIEDNMAQVIIQGIRMLTYYHRQQKVVPYPTLTVNINTFGGSWYAGIAIYHALKAYPGEVVTIVESSAMSMGAIILQAGDRRLANKYSTIMVHDGEDHVSGNRNDVKGWSRHAEEMWKQMYRILADKSGKKTTYWKKRCAQDYILNSDKALSEGLVDEVLGD